MSRRAQVRMETSYGADGFETPPGMDNMDPWTVTLRYRRRKLTVPFYMGHGHYGAEPKTSDVLDCLLSDASGFECYGSFEEWAENYGYDPDSRKAHAIYRAVERQANKLRRFLGEDYADATGNPEGWAQEHAEGAA